MKNAVLFKDWLETCGLSIQELADQLGVVRGSIYNYRNGFCYPSGKVLKELSRLSNGKITIESFEVVTDEEKQG